MKKILLATLLLTACASETVPETAEQVRVVRRKDELGKRCKVIGKRKALPAERDPREDALKAGADTIYLYGASGEAYYLRCRPALAERGQAEKTPPAKAPSRELPRLDAPNFAPEPAEALPETKPDSLPEAATPTE